MAIIPELFSEPIVVDGLMCDVLADDEGSALGESLTESVPLDIPDERQDNDFACGAAVTVSVARYFSVEPDTESEAIHQLRTSPAEGTKPEHIIQVLDNHGLECTAVSCMELDDLEHWLAKGNPVITPIQAWGNPEDYERNESGHYVVVAGIDGESVYVQDPISGPGRVPRDEFYAVWHDKDADGTLYLRHGIAVKGKRHGATDLAECGGQGGKPGPCPHERAEGHAQGILSQAGGAVTGMAAKAVEKGVAYLQSKYADLERDFGRTGALAILGATVALTPVPAPGTSLLPIALAKGYLALRRRFQGGEAMEGEPDPAAMVAAVKALLAELAAELGEEGGEVDDSKIREALGLTEAKDSSGHEHKGKGKGGGQFTANQSGKSQNPVDKPSSASTIVDKKKDGATMDPLKQWASLDPNAAKNSHLSDASKAAIGRFYARQIEAGRARAPGHVRLDKELLKGHGFALNNVDAAAAEAEELGLTSLAKWIRKNPETWLKGLADGFYSPLKPGVVPHSGDD